MSEELPEGWACAELHEITEIRGGIQKQPKRAPKHNAFPYLRVANVLRGRLDLSEIERMELFGDELNLLRLEPGDLLIVEGNGSITEIGRSALWHGEIPDCVHQNHIIRVRSRHCLPEYLNYYWNSPAGIEQVTAVAVTTSGLYSLSTKKVASIRVPIAPLAEQRRIVAKVEALLSQVNAARERLAKVPLILKRFRHAVLSAACSGRLTEKWREQTPISATRRSSQVLSSQGARDAPLPDVPETWMWRRLPELGELGRGKSRHRPRNDPKLYGGAYPFIQTGEIARSGGRIQTHTQFYNEFGLAQSKLWPAGTVCITIAANIADSAILTYPACFPDSVVGFIANLSLCLAEYVEFFIRTAREDLLQYAPATAQRNINLEILGEVLVPLPPLEEQHEIVRNVTSLLKVADVVEERARLALAQLERTPQSILAKAFSGQLVPVEAELARAEGRSFESAEQLLARVKSELERNPGTSKRRGPRLHEAR